MFETIERPSVGKPMRAAWGTRLADRVNELGAATSPGMLAREGLGFCGAEPIPTSRRVLRSAVSLPGCFVISSIKPAKEDESKSGNDNEYKITFKNTYYRVGGITYRLSDDECSGIFRVPCIIYLSISADGENQDVVIDSAESLARLREREADDRFYRIPLYVINKTAGIDCDLRNAPSASMFEFDPGVLKPEEES